MKYELSSSEAGDAKKQYDEFLKSVVVAHKESFDGFEYEAHRVVEFLSVYLIGQKKYALVFKIFQYVCVLSHG